MALPIDSKDARTDREKPDAGTRASNVTHLPGAGHPARDGRRENLRIVEALLFAASEPLDEATIGKHLPAGESVPDLLEDLCALYATRGITLVRVAGKWARYLRTGGGVSRENPLAGGSRRRRR